MQTSPSKSLTRLATKALQQPHHPILGKVLQLMGLRVELGLVVGSYRIGVPTDTPGLIRPPDRMSTVARSSASRSGFSGPSGITAVPHSMRLMRWLAAAMIATGDEMPGCRCLHRSQTLSKPSASARSIIDSVCSCPGPGSGLIEPADRQEPEPAQRLSAFGHGSGRDGGSVRARLRGRLQRLRDDVRDVGHWLDLQRLEHIGRHVVQVWLVALRDENG